jgi:hypothetical protein
VSQGGKRDEPVHVNTQEEHLLKSLGNPGAINTPLADYGRNGDTEIVRINPPEGEILKMLGGSGTINPETGLVEYGLFDWIGRAFNWLGDKLNDGLKKIGDGIRKIVENTWKAIKRDPLEEIFKYTLIYLNPASAFGVTAFTNAWEGLKHDVPFEDIARNAAVAAATQYVGSYVTGSDWYKNNVGNAASKLTDYTATSQAAIQKIIDTTASSTATSFVVSKLTKSKDPWGDMVRGGLAGGITAGANIGLDYLNGKLPNGAVKNFTSSDTFKGAYSAAVQAGVLKRPVESAIAGSLVSSFTQASQKWLKDVTNPTAKLQTTNKAADEADATLTKQQDKIKGMYDIYTKEDQAWQDRISPYKPTLDNGQRLVNDYNTLADGVIKWGGPPYNTYSRDKIFSLLDAGYQIEYTAPQGTVYNSDTLRNQLNDFGQWYSQNEDNINNTIAGYNAFQINAQAKFKPEQDIFGDLYVKSAAANSALDSAGAEYLNAQTKNIDYISNATNATYYYQQALGDKATEAGMNSILDSYNPDKPTALIDTAKTISEKEYATANPGKTLTDTHWQAILDPDTPHLSEDYIKKIYAQEGIDNPTQAQIDKFAYDKKDNLANDQTAIDQSYQSQQEIQDYFKNEIGRDPTDAEIKNLLGQADKTATTQLQKIDVNETSEQEIQDYFKQNVGRAPTPQEIKNLKQGNEAASTKAMQAIDESEINKQEALDIFTKQGVKNPTTAQIDALLNSGNETTAKQKAIEIDKSFTDKDEAEEFLSKQGIYNPTQAQIDAILNRPEAEAQDVLSLIKQQKITDSPNLPDAIKKLEGIYETDPNLYKDLVKGFNPSVYRSKSGKYDLNNEQLFEDYLLRGKDKGYDFYTDAQEITPEEAKAILVKAGMQSPPQELINQLVGKGLDVDQTAAYSQAQKISDPYVLTYAEAVQAFKNENNGINPNAKQQKELLALVNQSKTNPYADNQTAFETKIHDYADPLFTSKQEVIDQFAKYGLTPSDADIAKYAKLTESKSFSQIEKYVDPLYTDKDEVDAAVKKILKDAATPEILKKYEDQFVGAVIEKDQLKNITTNVNDHYLTSSEFKTAFKKQYGLNPSEETINKYIGYTGDVNQTDKLKLNFKELDPFITTKAEVDAKFADYGIKPKPADYRKYAGYHPDTELDTYLDTKYPGVKPKPITPPVTPTEPLKPLEPEVVNPPTPVTPVVVEPEKPITPPVTPPTPEPEKPPVVEPETPTTPPTPTPEPEKPPVVEPEKPVTPKPPVEPPVTPPTPEPEKPPVTTPTDGTEGTLNPVVVTPKEDEYTYDEVGNLYKNGTLYRTADSALGVPVEGDEFTTDSLGNIFKNGTLYRTKESANGGDVPVYDPTKVKPIVYKSPTGKPITKKPTPPPTTPPTTPTKPTTIPTTPTTSIPANLLAAYSAATAPLSTTQYIPQATPVVQESPYFDMRKKFDPGMFGSYNPMTMYGSSPSTNTRTNQPKVATMATGGYLDEKPMSMEEILNILERG